MTSEEYKEQLSEALGKLAGVHAVGDSWITFDGSIPAGGVPFTGQLVTRAMYADLWAWVQANKTVVTDAAWQTTANAQNGMNAAYSSGDGSTTFRLPCVVGGYLCAGDTSTAGGYVKEGLPNITGRIYNSVTVHGVYEPSGVFASSSQMGGTRPYPESGKGDLELIFDASRSNSIYGNSQHVTPETFKVMVGVYAFGVTGAVGESTEAGLVAEMNHKADIDASNFSTAGKNVLAGMGMPSNRYIDLTLGASGTTYTAPANGWFNFKFRATGSNHWIAVHSEGLEVDLPIATAVSTGGVLVPQREGSSVILYYADGIQSEHASFIYAAGAS